MKQWDCEQNSEQWLNLRRGLPTASELHRVVCPEPGSVYRCETCGTTYTRKRAKCAECKGPDVGDLTEMSIVKPSTQADGYIYRLIAESMGGPLESATPNRWIEQGHEREGDAATEYEFITGLDTQKVGFCTTDDRLIGASPDRLVGEDGLLEIKSPSPWVHIRHVITGDLESDHRVQVQAQLLVTGRKWCDVMSFNSDFAPGSPIPRAYIIRVYRDEEFISGMNEILVEFVTKLHRTRAELIAKYGDFRQLPVAPPVDALGVSDEDLEMILAAQRTG